MTVPRIPTTLASRCPSIATLVKTPFPVPRNPPGVPGLCQFDDGPVYQRVHADRDTRYPLAHAGGR